MDPSLFRPGDLLASYRIEEHKENFGLLQCFQATHLHSSATVSIYVQNLWKDPLPIEAVRAFKERAERLRLLRADRINPLLEADIDEDLAWAAFALPDGESLFDFKYHCPPFDVRSGAALLRSIGKALQEAHSAGFHGMLKPTAIYLDERGALRTLDQFGIAMLFEMLPETPLHAAPERWKEGRPLTARMDIFSAAAIVWEAIAGDEPGAISGHDPHRNERIRQPYPSLRSLCSDVPQGFSDMLARWMSHNEDERPVSWMAALAELEGHFEGHAQKALTKPAAPHPTDEDAAPSTLPSSLIVQTRMAPRSAEHAQALPSDRASAPAKIASANSAKNTSVSPARPSPSAPITNAPPIDGPKSTAQAPMESAVKPELLRPAMEAGSSTKTLATPRSGKAKVSMLSWFAALLLMGGGLAAILATRTAERTPHAPTMQNHIASLAPIMSAQTSAKIGFSEGQRPQDNNTKDPNSEAQTAQSPHRAHGGSDAREAEIKGDRHDPDLNLNVRVYAATPSN